MLATHTVVATTIPFIKCDPYSASNTDTMRITKATTPAPSAIPTAVPTSEPTSPAPSAIPTPVQVPLHRRLRSHQYPQ